MLALKPSDVRPAYKNQVNFDNFNHPHKNLSHSLPTLKTSHLRPAGITKSNLIQRPKTSIFRPAHKDEVDFDPRTKNKPVDPDVNFDPAREHPNNFQPHNFNQFNFDLHSDIKPISKPRCKNSINFDHDVENKSFATWTQNQIIADPLHWFEVIFDNPRNNQIRFTLHGNQVNLDLPHWNQVNLDHLHEIQVNLHANTESKWFSPHVQRLSQIRPPTQQPNQPHQVKFELHL